MKTEKIATLENMCDECLQPYIQKIRYVLKIDNFIICLSKILNRGLVFLKTKR